MQLKCTLLRIQRHVTASWSLQQVSANSISGAYFLKVSLSSPFYTYGRDDHVKFGEEMDTLPGNYNNPTSSYYFASTNLEKQRQSTWYWETYHHIVRSCECALAVSNLDLTHARSRPFSLLLLRPFCFCFLGFFFPGLSQLVVILISSVRTCMHVTLIVLYHPQCIVNEWRRTELLRCSKLFLIS